MPNWIIDTSRLNFAAARLALLPGTEPELEQVAQFADYLERCVATRLQMYHVPYPRPQTPYPADAVLHRGAPMRPQSMTSTPSPAPPLPQPGTKSEIEQAFNDAQNAFSGA